MSGTTELTCARHGVPTRITCVECDTPICPDCAIRTPVGLKCPDHASRPAKPRPTWVGGVGLLLLVAVAISLVQFARHGSGTTKKATSACPTEPAPDVGIGPQGAGSHWKEVAESGLCGRYDASAVWTGKEMLVWGGESCAGGTCPSDQSPHLGDGAAYVPASDSWHRLARSPLAGREAAATAWTGTELLLWGGTTGQALMADGAAFDPARDKWRTIAPSPLAPRTASVSAWTGRELLVWGGSDLADGAAYDPAANKWRTLAAGPLAGRSAAVSAWTGRELVVWGGVSLDGNKAFTDGAAYDPASDRWRTLGSGPLSGRYTPAATWTGTDLLIWGGNAPGSLPFADGAAYDPATDQWRTLPPAPVVGRTASGAVWTGKEMVLWGGVGVPRPTGNSIGLDPTLGLNAGTTPLEDGAAYDPASDRWRVLEPVPLLGRAFPVSVWDGQGMILWGGLTQVDSPASAADGARYTP
ncbi:MAG TPA: hypothetical protein VHT30_06825 [Acidimicrobiales bacterium]|nr:hypothetical protein [Acidimicrobiales bacterium]